MLQDQKEEWEEEEEEEEVVEKGDKNVSIMYRINFVISTPKRRSSRSSLSSVLESSGRGSLGLMN